MWNSRWRIARGKPEHLGRVVEVTRVDYDKHVVSLQFVSPSGALEPEQFENTVLGHLMTTTMVDPGPHLPRAEEGKVT